MNISLCDIGFFFKFVYEQTKFGLIYILQAILITTWCDCEGESVKTA